MRRIHAFGLALALLATPAFAQSGGTNGGVPVDSAKQALGVIVSIDAIAGAMTLDSGETFKLPDAVKSTELTVGNRVRVAFETDPMGLKVATAIAAVTDAPSAAPVTGARGAAPVAPTSQGGAG